MASTSTGTRRRSQTAPTPAPTSASPKAARSATVRTPSGIDQRYQLPVLGTTLPAGLMEKGFWGALVGSALLGAVDPPLAVLVGAGVLVARRRRD